MEIEKTHVSHLQASSCLQAVLYFKPTMNIRLFQYIDTYVTVQSSHYYVFLYNIYVSLSTVVLNSRKTMASGFFCTSINHLKIGLYQKYQIEGIYCCSNAVTLLNAVKS